MEGNSPSALCDYIDGGGAGSIIGVGQCQQADDGRCDSDPFGLQPILDRLGFKPVAGNRRHSSKVGNDQGLVLGVDSTPVNGNTIVEEKRIKDKDLKSKLFKQTVD